MLDDNETPTTTEEAEQAPAGRRRSAGRPAGPPTAVSFSAAAAETTAAPAPVSSIAALFQAPETTVLPAKAPVAVDEDQVEEDEDSALEQVDADAQSQDGPSDDDEDSDAPRRRRRSRGGRRRRKGDNDAEADTEDSSDEAEQADASAEGDEEQSTGSRRRRRRARAGEGADVQPDDPENTVVRVRAGRTAEDEITGVTGSTRLEAKKQRRREGREAGRRRAPIVSEAEFLARRESVKREMVVRQQADYTQIAVIEDNVLVEHYVARESQTSIIGNVYLGKVQNVLPSMEAAFVDIGAGRNAVLYAGEVDWTTFGNGKQRKIEDALTPGQTILVQASKDPIGQKGARLTSQISLPGRFLVLVPGGQTNGISRKLPENERARLKGLLKEVLPENTGVIVRTAAEGATEDQLTRDVTALMARWEVIEAKVAAANSGEAGASTAPELLYSEPDLMIKVVRDIFNEDFTSLVVEGDDAWDMIKGYIDHVAPDLSDRVTKWDNPDVDAFTSYRLDEQIHKALERKVHLPSGGSLVIDRTEAMTVVDVNTGKYTGSGGNLEETVTKNNLEAAEEVVRQLRLRDIGGIIVVDFIDMVLESNRELVLRRLVECLGRDRTRHQVAEVTSLGLVQMTRKRIGTGLLESFSTECEHCNGRGVVIQDAPVEPKKEEQRRGNRGGRGNNRGGRGKGEGKGNDAKQQADKPAEDKPVEEKPVAEPVAETVVEPVVEPAVEVQPEPATDLTSAEPAAEVVAAAPKVKVVKRTTRRRAAAKPAGPPTPVAKADSEPLPDAAKEANQTPVLTSEGLAP